MNRNAALLIESLNPDTDPEIIFKNLEHLSFMLWTRNGAFLTAFLKQKGLSKLIKLLQYKDPRKNDIESEKIRMKIHHGKHGPALFEESWSGVINGYAAEVLSKICILDSRLINMISTRFNWMIYHLKSMLSCGTSFEKYGALMAFGTFCRKSDLREKMIDEDLVLDLVNLVAETNQVKAYPPEQSKSLFEYMRWKLAIWRGVIEVVNQLMVTSGVDLYGKETAGKSIELRSDWRRLTMRNLLVSSLLDIIKKCHEFIPKKLEEKFATVYSGPGQFIGSGMQIRDMGPLIRSVIFTLEKIGYNDEETKRFLMIHSDTSKFIKALGPYMEEFDRDEMVQYLIFMGIGSPMSQTKAEKFRSQILSENPAICLRALKAIYSSYYLIDCEQQRSLFEKMGGIDVLLALIRSSSDLPPKYHHRVGNFKVQRNPNREAIMFPQNMVWKSALRGFSLAVLGKLCRSHSTFVLSKVTKENEWLIAKIQSILARKSSPIEIWGASVCLYEILEAFYSASYVRNHFLPLLSILEDGGVLNLMIEYLRPEKKHESISNFLSLNSTCLDLQWMLELNLSIVKILELFLKSRRQEFDFSSYDLNSISNLIFSKLDFIADLHVPNTKKKLKAFALPEENNYPISLRYDQDYTLPSLVYYMLSAVDIISSHCMEEGRAILTDSNAITLLRYADFPDIGVQKIVEKLYNRIFIPEVEAEETIDNHRGVADSGAGIWPEHLNSCSFYQDRELGSSEDSYVKSNPDTDKFREIKLCGNPFCLNIEIRKSQFALHTQSTESLDMNFCSKSCQHTFEQMKK